MMLTQRQHFERAQRRLFDANRTFMELVNCRENPMTREDLARCIEKRPAVWSRFSGFLATLSSEKDLA